jgi:hypothetical protein
MPGPYRDDASVPAEPSSPYGRTMDDLPADDNSATAVQVGDLS